MSKENDRIVKFNVAIADYRPGQKIRYGDMPKGHQFWADHDSILMDTRICEFVEEEKEKPNQIKTESENNGKSEDTSDNNKTDTQETDKENEHGFQNPDGLPATCPGINKDKSPCKSTKLMENGFCYFHQNQAPTGLTGSMPENMKPIIGLTK